MLYDTAFSGKDARVFYVRRTKEKSKKVCLYDSRLCTVCYDRLLFQDPARAFVKVVQHSMHCVRTVPLGSPLRTGLIS